MCVGVSYYIKPLPPKLDVFFLMYMYMYTNSWFTCTVGVIPLLPLLHSPHPPLPSSHISFPVDFSIMVLSSGAWPFTQGPPFQIPPEVRVCVVCTSRVKRLYSRRGGASVREWGISQGVEHQPGGGASVRGWGISQGVGHQSVQCVCTCTSGKNISYFAAFSFRRAMIDLSRSIPPNTMEGSWVGCTSFPRYVWGGGGCAIFGTVHICVTVVVKINYIFHYASVLYNRLYCKQMPLFYT